MRFDELGHLALGITIAFAAALAGAAQAADPFESLHCLRYAEGRDYPVDAILFGTDRGKTMNLPFVMCVARRGDETVVLDAGYVNQEIGNAWGIVGYHAYRPLFAEIGVKPEDVSLVTLSHLHWDHGGGTSAFPNAKFVVQRRELEFAAGGMTQNRHAQQTVLGIAGQHRSRAPVLQQHPKRLWVSVAHETLLEPKQGVNVLPHDRKELLQ